MKRHSHTFSILTLLAIAVFSSVLTAQDRVPKVEPQRPAANSPQDSRNAVLRQLGLTDMQVQRIRRLNQERKPLLDDAQRRLRESNRALDEIIYADNVNDADIQARLKDFQLAQAEVSKIRFMNELAVRRILTPEQLVRFRRLRARFEQNRNNAEIRLPATRQIQVNSVRPNTHEPFQRR